MEKLNIHKKLLNNKNLNIMKSTFNELQKNNINIVSKKITLVLFGLFTIGLNAQTIAGANSHSLFICSNGSVQATGENNHGQLGIGANSGVTLSPITVSGLTNIVAVASKNIHSLYLKSDGTVWACGNNSFGQLGIGNTTSSNVAVQITSLSGITKIATGNSHSLFLKNDGTVWACGSNNFGKLGIGNQTQKNTPIQVVGLSNIIEIAAGVNHSMFLKNDGTVKVCGSNVNGTLGIGNTTFELLPVPVAITNVIAIAGGFQHSIFVKQDGTVWASGSNDSGKLGDGTIISRSTPVQANNLSGIVKATAGQNHAFFLKNNGTAWSVGRNDFGQLGDGTLINKSSAVQVLNLTGITSVSAFNQSLFAKNNGTFFACGKNDGVFGNGIVTDIAIPVLVSIGCLLLSNQDFSTNQFNVNPNSSTGIFTIQTENPISNANITIADLNGRIVHESKTENLDNKTLDLNHLQNGIYILNISNGDYNHSQKIVKQ